MKKKILTLLSVCVFCTGLCGCTRVADMTEEEADLIAEYAACTLLRYDKNYNSKYIEDAMAEAKADAKEMMKNQPVGDKAAATEKPKSTKKPKSTAKPTAEPTATPEAEPTQEPVQAQPQQPEQPVATPAPLDEKMSPYDMGKLFGVEGVEINYIGFEAVDTYPVVSQDELAFTMEASQGTKLIASKFELINTTDAPKACNIAGQNIKFQMRFNGSDYIAAQKTLLTDDFAAFNGTLQPRQPVQVVVISQVNAGYESTISSVDMIVRIGGENTLIKLQ